MTRAWLVFLILIGTLVFSAIVPAQEADESRYPRLPKHPTAVDMYPEERQQDWWPAFEEAYRLTEGRMVTRIAPPYIPARTYFLYGTDSPDREFTRIILLAWDGPNIIRTTHMADRGYTVRQALQYVAGLKEPDFRVAPELLERMLLGDWSLEWSAPVASRVAGLVDIVRDATGLDVRLARREQEQIVVTVSGEMVFTPLPESPRPRLGMSPAETLYVYLDTFGKLHDSGMGSSTDFILQHLSNATGVQFEDDTSQQARKRPRGFVIYESAHMTPEEAATPEGEKKLDAILENLSRQLNLLFVKQRRVRPVWHLTVADEAPISP